MFLLSQVLTSEDFSKISAIDPSTMVTTLSFDNVIRLVTKIYALFTNDNAEPEYARRLLYTLKKKCCKRWSSDFRFEALLALVCRYADRYHEQFYALKRAFALIDPVPATLALDLAACSMPGIHLLSWTEHVTLCRYALKQYPCLRGLEMLITALEHMPESGHELNQCRRQLEKVISIWPYDAPPLLLPRSGEPYQFDSAELSVQFTITYATSEDVYHCIEKDELVDLISIAAAWIARTLSFQESMRLAYQLLQGSEKLQEYALDLLYAVAIERVEFWLDDWRAEAFLGFACERTHKWDEQFAALDRALSRSGERPANLCIALARCAFNENPWITFEEAIAYVQDALKEEMYVDALELLVRLYTQVGEQEKVIETQNALKALDGKGKHSPSYLPECLTSEKGFKG